MRKISIIPGAVTLEWICALLNLIYFISQHNKGSGYYLHCSCFKFRALKYILRVT